MMRCQISASLSVPVSIAAIPFTVTMKAPSWKRSVVGLRAVLEAIQERMPHGVLVQPLTLEGVDSRSDLASQESDPLDTPAARIRAEAQVELPRESSGWSRFDIVASAYDVMTGFDGQSEPFGGLGNGRLLDLTISDPIYRLRDPERFRPALLRSLYARALEILRGHGHTSDGSPPGFSLSVEESSEVSVERPDSATISLAATIEYAQDDWIAAPA